MLFRGRRGEPEAAPELAAMAADALYPVNVRATALALLGTNYPGAEATRALGQALLDEHPLIRRTAVSSLQLPEARAQAETLARRLEQAGIDFLIKPRIRFRGEVGEQATMFFLDPSGNALEFKSFTDPSQLFAH